MNGYASMTAAEHEEAAEMWARLADRARQGFWGQDNPKLRIRQAQGFATMHMEDAQRMRECGRQ